eukprot:gene58855-78531_t
MMEHRYCPMCAAPLVLRATEIDNDKQRLSCPDGHWTHWDNPLPVLAALVEVDGRILLARNAAWGEKNFALITGFMERGEKPEEGVARELKEETNLDADSIALIGVYEFIRKNELIIAYHVRASGQLQLSPELVEVRLVAPEKLKPWRAGTGYAMADWMRARGLQKDLDARGLNCPLPILKAKKALADMASGDVLRIIATDPGSVRDFQAFARQTGNELLEHLQHEKEFTFFMR